MLAAKRYGETDFVTGLRAIAALAVVLIHAGGAGLRELGPVGNNLADLGRTGVYVFFVISGFSVAASFKGDYGRYLAKRFLRLAPLYYFWLFAALLLGLQQSTVDARNIALHLAFLGFLDYQVTNSILGVEWSISIEAFWYLLVPLMLAFAVSGLRVSLMLLATFALYIVSVEAPFLPADNPALAMHWSPFPYAFSYALGVTSYRLRPQWAGWRPHLVLGVAAAAVLASAVAPRWILRVFHDELLLVSLATFAVLCCGTTSGWMGRLLANRTMLHLGTISYGIYLCHVPVISLLHTLGVPGVGMPFFRFVYAACLAVAVSTLTYRWVELPFLRVQRAQAA